MVSVWEIIQHGCLEIHDPGGPFQGPHKLPMKENLWGHNVPSTLVKLNKQNMYEKTADQNQKERDIKYVSLFPSPFSNRKTKQNIPYF